MRRLIHKFALFGLLSISMASAQERPKILSVDPDGSLTWSNNVPGLISVIEKASTLSDGTWEPYYFDWGTNGLRTIGAPPVPVGVNSFFRVSVVTNVIDSSLLVHLPFDNDFIEGVALDASGHGNHGLQFGRPGTSTNWPAAMQGPDGSQAAEFHSYFDGYGLYGRSGDYVAVPITPELSSLPKATISIWAHYFTSLNNEIANDHTSTLMNSGKDFAGTFFFGRQYANYTSFSIATGPTTGVRPLIFPDASPVGNSGGWHHYVVTFDAGTVKGYFDGELFASEDVAVAALAAAGRYIGVSCWTFNVTPDLDLSVDGHPNNAWINGAVDDIRIYDRVLDGLEIQSLYRSFDKLPPTAPLDFVATASSSSIASLRWTPSTDLFGVADYIVYRDGAELAQISNTTYFDENLLPETSYAYTVRARDTRGQLSAPAPVLVIDTPPIGVGVDLMIDDGDNSPWVQPSGSWTTTTVEETVLTGVLGPTFVGDDATDKGKLFKFVPPNLEPGDYQVSIWYPGKSDATHLFSPNVPVDIVSAGVTNTVVVNQRNGIGQWNLLGTFSLSTDVHVSVRTDGTSTSHFVVADAVRFVKPADE